MNLYRPIYHFIPEKNWMNDPNGLLYFNGEYHLFYQYNPYADYWETMHWGHAKSKDLVHWEHLPIALYPSHELGETHCFSGCAVNNEGVPTIFYTSIGSDQRSPSVGAEQWMATSHDDMLSWEKHSGNPVLSLDAHGELDIKEWRDPFVWKEGETWYMVVGGTHNDKGCALIYSSANLLDWRFLNKLLEGTEKIWECPNFFKLGDKYVLIYSPNGEVKYYTGTWNADYTFSPEVHGTVDYSGWEGFYAPNSLLCPQGRRLMWGWIPENARGEFRGNAGWAGMQSIPRVLTIDAQGVLLMEPAVELQSLRTNPFQIDNTRITSANQPTGIRGRALEIEAEFELEGNGSCFGIKLLRSPLGDEETVLTIEPKTGSFSIDRTRSSLSDQPHNTKLSGFIDLSGEKTVKLHLFLDHSVIEVFVNYKQCLSTRIYPTLDSSDGVYLFAEDGASVLAKSLCIWELQSIWE